MSCMLMKAHTITTKQVLSGHLLTCYYIRICAYFLCVYTFVVDWYMEGGVSHLVLLEIMLKF